MNNKEQQLEINSPWLDEKDWLNGQIHSSARSAFYLSLFFALFWNAISFPIALYCPELVDGFALKIKQFIGKISVTKFRINRLSFHVYQWHVILIPAT